MLAAWKRYVCEIYHRVLPTRVCPRCGWTSDANGVFYSHKTSWGYPCKYEGTGDPLYLSHVFKTDVVKLTFFTSDAADYKTMLSVMYALLEGLSRELGIERTDLKGCLHQQNWSGNSKLLFSIILYDAVAGGAGHVRRLVTDDGAAFARVLKAAFYVGTSRAMAYLDLLSLSSPEELATAIDGGEIYSKRPQAIKAVRDCLKVKIASAFDLTDDMDS